MHIQLLTELIIQGQLLLQTYHRSAVNGVVTVLLPLLASGFWLLTPGFWLLDSGFFVIIPPHIIMGGPNEAIIDAYK